MVKTSILNDPLYAAKVLKYKVHTQNLHLQDIAKYLKILPSGLTQAMKRDNSLNRHIKGISKYLHCPASDFTGLPEGETKKILAAAASVRAPSRPKTDLAETVSVADATAGLADITNMSVGEPSEDGVYRLNVDCVLKRMDLGNGLVNFLLLGPERAKLRLNDRVFVRTKDGREVIRRYSVDPEKPEIVVLLPMHDSETPIVLMKKQIAFCRVLIAPLQLKAE